MTYRYYLTQRPPSLGAFPNHIGNGPIEVHSFDNKEYAADIDRKAWGYVNYKEQLTAKEIDEYELMMAIVYTIQEVFSFPVGTRFLDHNGLEVELIVELI